MINMHSSQYENSMFDSVLCFAAASYHPTICFSDSSKLYVQYWDFRCMLPDSSCLLCYGKMCSFLKLDVSSQQVVIEYYKTWIDSSVHSLHLVFKCLLGAANTIQMCEVTGRGLGWDRRGWGSGTLVFHCLTIQPFRNSEMHNS